MNCGDVRSRLSGYLDGDAPAGERTAILEHIEGCPACRGELYELAKTLKRLGSLSGVEPPPLFAQRVMRKVREEAGARRGLLRRLFFPLHVKLPAEALAVALVAVAAVYVYNAMRPEFRTEVASPPAAEAPAREKGEEIIPLLDEAKEAPPGKQATGLERGAEDEAQAFRKSEGPPFLARKPAPAQEAETLDAAASWEEGAPSSGAAATQEAAPQTARGAIEEKAVMKDKEAGFEVTVLVPDAEAARPRVEDAVRRAGGRLLEEPPSEENAVVAEVARERLADLVKELETVGEVSPGREAFSGGIVRVIIELREKQR